MTDHQMRLHCVGWPRRAHRPGREWARKTWWQRYWARVRWSIWYHRERRRAATLDRRRDVTTCAPDGADEALEVDPAVAAARRVLAARGVMDAEPVAGDGPGESVCYAVVLHMLMSRDELDLWQTFADRRWLEVDDAVHVAALSGLTYQLACDGDEVGRHAAEVCAWELIARLGLEGCAAPQRAGPGWT
jgi:hypothetical protein